MLTLEEAIKHCEEVAERHEELAFDLIYRYGTVSERARRYKIIASEYRQLAEWLRELKAIKEVIDNQGDTNNAWIFLEKIEDILYPINEITYDKRGR